MPQPCKDIKMTQLGKEAQNYFVKEKITVNCALRAKLESSSPFQLMTDCTVHFPLNSLN